eukprot:Hpha_TRINITY_DN770_c0_g1::TRINITY_DN770_c0_g1_i1::g.28873::m.28873/K12189/VPS25, EAP20; ESCRT-II complex subunit VPS25
MESQRSVADVPWFSMPAAFTLQPNSATRAKQLELWGRRVLDHCRSKRQWKVQPDDPVFSNPHIRRRLPDAGVSSVFETLVSTGQAEWVSRQDRKQGVWALWKTLPEWSDAIHAWVVKTGRNGSVCTLFELLNLDGVPWQDAPQDLLMVMLTHLEDTGRAAVIRDPGGEGVKFV